VKRNGIGIAILAIALAALLSFAACAPAPVAGEKTVEIAAIEPITGATAGPTQVCLLGFQDYFAYFNEQGEIPGVTVRFLWGDTSRVYGQFYSHYEKFLARGIHLMVAAEDTGLSGLKDRFAKDEVVMFGSIIGFQDMIYAPGWRYFQAPTLCEQFAVVAEQFKENWKEDRPPKMVFMGMESPWSFELRGEGGKYAQSLGFEVLSPLSPWMLLLHY
jgi:branched-chain amino acid transport system substrate-binding protein